MPINWQTEPTPSEETPAITNLVATANSTTATSATIVSNSATGTIYYVVSSSNTRPANATIETGTITGAILASGNASSAVGTVNLGAETGFTAGVTVHYHTVLKIGSTYYEGPSATVNLPATAGDDFGTSLSAPTISYSRTSGTAPMGVLMERTQTSTSSRVTSGYERHDIETKWAFGNAGNFSALTLSPIWGTDRNVAYGFGTGTIYDSDGSKTITVTSWDGGAQLTSTFASAITVNDPDTVFAGADTAVVSGSDFAGKPTGASEFTSIAQAKAHLSGRTNARLLLRADETFSGFDIGETGGSNRRLYIGAFGSGARPIINVTGTTITDRAIDINTGGKASTNYEEIIIDGLDLRGPGDPTASSPPAIFTRGILIKQAGSLAHKTIWNCRFSGFGVNIEGDGNTATERGTLRLYVGDTRIDGWSDYGFFATNGGDILFTGTSIKQPAGVRQGDGKDNRYPNHGPFRCSRAEGLTVFANCDFQSTNDWLNQTTTNNTMQPIIRWRSKEIADNPKLVLDRFRGEGGPLRDHNQVADEGGATSGTPGRNDPSWVLMDRIFCLFYDHPRNPVSIGLGGTTMRNAVLVVSNNNAWWGTGYRSNDSDFVYADTGPNTASADNFTRRAELYSSALSDLRSDTYANNSTQSSSTRPWAGADLSRFSPNYVANNIEYSPSLTTGTTSPATNLSTTSRWTPLVTGRIFETGSINTDYTPPANSTASFKPLTGSNAIGAASGKVSLLDMDGNLRATVLDGVAGKSAHDIGPYETTLGS